MNYYYNPFSKKGSTEQWFDFLQQSAYFDSHSFKIGDYLKKSTSDMQSFMEQLSEEQIQAIKESEEMICGSIDAGINNVVNAIGTNTNKLYSLLDWHMTRISDEIRINNVLGENIALLLRIPDYQKERQNYIEQGLKFYANTKYDSDLYKDSLGYFQKAYDIEPTDYFVLHRIGMIYLYAGNLLDLPKAEQYFRQAAKYAIVETNPGAVKLANILVGDVRNRLAEQMPDKDDLKLFAADCYLQAGFACYAQTKYAEAAKLFGIASSTAPYMTNAIFAEAKALSASGEYDRASPKLEQSILKDRNYAVKALCDMDLGPKAFVRNLIKKLRDDAVKQARDGIEKIRCNSIKTSAVLGVLKELDSKLASETYLNALDVIDEINKERTWNYQRLTVLESTEVLNLSSWSIREKFNCRPPQISNDGRLLAIDVCFDTMHEHKYGYGLGVWDIMSGENVYLEEGRGDKVCFHEESKALIVSHFLGWSLVEIHNPENRHSLSNSPEENTETLCCSLDGKTFAYSNFYNKIIKVLKITGKSIQSINDIDIETRDFCLSPDGQILAVIVKDEYVEKIRIINLLDNRQFNLPEQIKTLSSGNFTLCFSPDGSMLGLLELKGVKIWDAKNFKLIKEYKNDHFSGCVLSFSADSKMLAASSFSEVFFINLEADIISKKYLNLANYFVFNQRDNNLIRYGEDGIAIWEMPKVGIIQETVQANMELFCLIETTQEEKNQRFTEKVLQNHAQAEILYETGLKLERKEDEKWFFKNYSTALATFEETLGLGKVEAQERIKAIKLKMK